MYCLEKIKLVGSTTDVMKKTAITFVWILLLAYACREKYVPKLDLPASSFLVVEGYINSGTGPTTITLSRTTKLSDTAMITYEAKAIVRIEGKTNTTPIVLTETSKGKYTVPQLTLNANDQYRIYIKTSNGKEYVSTYSSVRTTPPIDSISWTKQADGVQIYANTHDPSGKSRYYQYSYEETWEFRSDYMSTLKLGFKSNGSKFVAYSDSVRFSHDTLKYRCWQKNIASKIVTATSEQLSEDIIALKPLVYIEPGSWKFDQLYTILVKQRAVSREGHMFLEQVRKNTEQLGSIFDAQPSDNTGNIRCITNAEELAVGFIEVTQEREQRIWISKNQVPGWSWDRFCGPEIRVKNENDTLDAFIASGAYTLTNVADATPTGAILYAYAAKPTCVDCRLLGSSVKPAFWP